MVVELGFKVGICTDNVPGRFRIKYCGVRMDFSCNLPVSVLVVEVSLRLKISCVCGPMRLLIIMTLESLSPTVVKGRTVYPGVLEGWILFKPEVNKDQTFLVCTILCSHNGHDSLHIH